jgi:transcriptional regulator with XRE-family HTH domain
LNLTQIISKYRAERELSLRDFAAQLGKDLPETISHQTIKNWEDGVTKPSYYLIYAIAMNTFDWRRDMAFEILAVLRPDLHPVEEANG